MHMDHAGSGNFALAEDPPRSATPTIQMAVVAVTFVFAAWVVLWLRPTQDPAMAAVLMIALMAVPGALSEYFLVQRRAGVAEGMRLDRGQASVQRVMQKIVGLWAIYGAMLFGYLILPVYDAPLYEAFLRTFPVVLPWIMGLSIPYIALVDGMQAEPEDRLWRFGGLLLLREVDRDGIGNWLLGWLVKAFFLPLMFCFLTGYIANLWAFTLTDEGFGYRLFILSYQSLYFIDVAVGTLGYCMTLRLLGTHIRSAQPTVAGWVVALMCYPPFWPAISQAYLKYNPDWEWEAWLAGAPVLFAIWAVMILACLVVYVWATMAFGLRFSNLTHRGVITNGPYRYTKHPAYIAKNLSWWLVAIPFIPEDGSFLTALSCCLMLLGVNTVYFLRAKTEERHLMEDPEYRAYAAWIERNGIFRRR